MTISNYLQYNNPIRIIWRAGTVEDPYVDISESWRIINNKIVLTEIPDEFYRVRITNYVEVLDKNKILLSNEFRVNYQNSIVEFNPTEENKTIQATYKGRGQILYPASRIYTNNNNPDIIETLQDIVDNHQDAIDAEAQLVQTKTDVVTATNNAQAVADNTKHLGDYNSTTTYVENNIVTYNGSSYMNILSCTNILPTNTTYWKVVALKGLGDMNKSVYDTDGDGVVDLAEDSTKLGGQLPAYYAPQSDVDNKIGILTNLQTTEKTNLVGAINEINTELNSPEYSSLLVQEKDIFTTGTSKDGTDVSASVVEGALSDIKLKGMTLTNITKEGNVATSINSLENAGIGILPNGQWNALSNYSASEQVINVSTNDKVFLYFKAKSSSVGRLRNQAILRYSDDTSTYVGDLSNDKLEVYGILTVTKTLPANVKVGKGLTGQVDRDYQIAINMTALGIANYTEQQMLEIARRGYITGTKSTVSVALDSVGKNLFDGELELGYYDINNGSKISSTSRIRNKNLIKVGIDNYFISGLPATDKYLLVFDESKNLLTSTYLSASITTRSVTISQKGYIAFYSVSTDMNLNIQLEKGNIATEWEKYKHSQALYTLPVGEENRRLPNGIYDEIDGSGKRTKRTKKHALLTSNITSLITSGVNTDYIQIDNLPSIKGGTTGVDGQTIINGYKEIDYNSIDTTNGANSHYLGTNGGVRIIVPKGTYATLTDAQNDLIAKGTSVIYQLAKEETTQLEGVTLPVGFKGGTITIRPQDDSAEFVAPEFEYKVTLNKSAQIDGNTRMSRQNAEEIIRIYARLDVAGI